MSYLNAYTLIKKIENGIVLKNSRCLEIWLKFDDDGGIYKYYDNEKLVTIRGIFHKENSPAIVYNNIEHTWYLNGNLHRVLGPAVVRKKQCGYHHNGTKYISQMHLALGYLKYENSNKDQKNLTGL